MTDPITRFDQTAERELQIFLGTDRIVRINVDGICVLRVRLDPGSIFVVDNMNEKAKVKDLRTALEESVKLQSHYACLLNNYEAFISGSKRLQFANADAWIARLRVTGALK